MEIRKATAADLDTALDIYATARAFMRTHGNPHQWGEDYPSSELLCEDIAEKRLFLIEKEGVAQGVFAFFPEGDPIYDAKELPWSNALPYAAIHRVASAGKAKGVLRACIDFCLAQCPNLKIDTHKQNTVMQSALLRYGFSPCGTAMLPGIGERILFQLYLPSSNQKSTKEQL